MFIKGTFGLIFIYLMNYCGSKSISQKEPEEVPTNQGKRFVPSDPSSLTLGEDPPSDKEVRRLLDKLLKQFGAQRTNVNQDKSFPYKLDPRGNKVWTFAFSNDGYPANYIDNSGQLVGQSVDIVKKICQLAKKQCRVIIVPRAHCWDDTSSPGISRVLDQHQYDICANLVESPDRRLAYSFPRQSIYKIPHPIIIAKPNSKITLERLRTCHKFTVAYPSLTAVNRDCLLAAGFYVKRTRARPVVASGSIVAALDKIVDQVLSYKVDVGLVMPRLLARTKDVKILGEAPCLNVAIGLNMMARVDDLDFLSWWDSTLTKFLCKGGKSYTDFCKEQEHKYGIDPLCFKPGIEADCTSFGYSKRPPAKTDTTIVEPCV